MIIEVQNMWTYNKICIYGMYENIFGICILMQNKDIDGKVFGSHCQMVFFQDLEKNKHKA